MSLFDMIAGGNPASWQETAERAISAIERLAAAVEAHNAVQTGKCLDCEQAGRLRCPTHGPVVVPNGDGR
ncbi:hypothetical protein AVJ28_gp80 [Mycobacterium phage Baee]|uniref:Uncharacterized protein n=1 Tax=Mycobacterium phage Baee TaxID=1647306 RepID=A0A0F6YQA8_9CAUD|nr:hypothetical protein AVJ28_gp80 [Mycobacterium phage Baee]AKF14649.1 hypothetical protein SEA_BAEE_80 [Mycobacterium phage Baee]